MKRITVFGGSQPRPGDPAYEDALRLGRRLGGRGYTVLTGGYIGTMEAVSRGAAESGGHVIGVTCDEIERFRPGSCNRWVQEELRFPSLRQRLFGLIESCDAALALPGGPGTLTEISLMWNHLVIGAIAPRPLILIGPGWRSVFESFYADLGPYIPPAQRGLLQFAVDGEEAVDLLIGNT